MLYQHIFFMDNEWIEIFEIVPYDLIKNLQALHENFFILKKKKKSCTKHSLLHMPILKSDKFFVKDVLLFLIMYNMYKNT